MVLSPAAYNSKVGLALLCPIPTRIKGYPFEVLLPEGLKINGAVLSDHRLLPERASSKLSWTINMDERKHKAAEEARPFKEKSTIASQNAAQLTEQLKELKKVSALKSEVIEEAEKMIADLTSESRTNAAKAKEIQNAVYDLKAVNPNKKADTDDRTPEDLLDIIETKGREIAEALAILRIAREVLQ